MSILKTRFSRCAQVIAAWRSAGDLASLLSMVFGPLPRLAGVTSPRQRWYDNTLPGQEVFNVPVTQVEAMI